MKKSFLLVIICNVLKLSALRSIIVTIGLILSSLSSQLFANTVPEFLAVYSGECEVLPLKKIDISTIDVILRKTEPDYVRSVSRDPAPGCNRDGTKFIPNHFATLEEFSDCLNLKQSTCLRPNKDYTFNGLTPFVRIKIDFKKQDLGFLKIKLIKISSKQNGKEVTLNEDSIHPSLIGFVEEDDRGYTKISKSFLNSFLNSEHKSMLLNIAVYSSTDAFYLREMIKALGLPLNASKFDL